MHVRGHCNLRNKRALVTGGSRGIGLATARALRGQGAHVTIVARDEVRVKAAAAEVGAEGIAADVTSADAMAALLEEVERRWGGPPDLVVHAAGAFELAAIAETSIESFDRQIAVNLRGAFLLIRGVLPSMLKRGSGHIVSVGSIAGRQAFPANGAYSASKFGLLGLHAVLDAELRGTGVRATLIEPAATDTDLWDSVDRARYAGLPERSAMLSADAVAQAVLYAVSQPGDVTVPNLRVERA